MYKSLLIFKYLRRRRIAWVSLIGVMLCTAMVLIVISVMGGWLTMFKAKFHGMTGDIVVTRGGVGGFAGYEQMIEKIEKLPAVAQAVPIIQTFGLLNISNQRTEAVQVTGLPLEKYSTFNAYRESLFRQYKEPLRQGKPVPPTASFDLVEGRPYEAYRPTDPQALGRPGMIIGAPILFAPSERPDDKRDVPDWAYNVWCRLEVVPMSGERLTLRDTTPSANIYWIVDVSRTKVSFLDERSVYVPFDVLQRDLRMNQQPYKEVVDGKEVDRVRPARCHELQVRIKPGANREAVMAEVNGIVQTISQETDPRLLTPPRVEPWERQYATFLSAVENEKSLLTFLLGLISLVAIFLIFCILYMIVVEKTRDIGIIKSVGATAGGIATVFLGYGLAIGVVGGLLGLAAGWLVMTYINELHGVIAGLIGKPIWDPEVYAFDRIPDTVDPTTAVVVVAVAIVSAVIGAVVPAIRAARLNPVEALRYE